MINLLLITIVLILMLLLILYYIRLKGSGIGVYVDYSNTFIRPENKITGIINNNQINNIPQNNISKLYFTNSYDLTFKDGFCKASKLIESNKNAINKYLNQNIYNIKTFVEFENERPNKSFITTSNKIIYNNFKDSKYNNIIFLEANENFSSHHWYKSICSDIKNICSILSFNDVEFIKSRCFGSFQANYDYEMLPSPYHGNYDETYYISPQDARNNIIITFYNMFVYFENIKQNGHYYVLFSSFVDSNKKLINKNNISKTYVDIDLIKIFNNSITFQDIIKNIILKYTSISYYKFNYSFNNNDGNYSKLFKDILNDCGYEINYDQFTKKFHGITPIKNFKYDCNINFINKYVNNLYKRTCIFPDAYTML